MLLFVEHKSKADEKLLGAFSKLALLVLRLGLEVVLRVAGKTMSSDGIARLERLGLACTKRGRCGDDVQEHAILVVRLVLLAGATQTGL